MELRPVIRYLIMLFVLASESIAAHRPNILLIVSDDQGYSDLGLLNPDILTPNLDRLAREGTRLTSFYVAWPACTPSRGAFLTGRYPQRNGIYDMIRNEAPDYGLEYTPEQYAVTWERIGGMDTREVLIPAVLKTAGYRSAIYGKWDLGTHRRFLPTARGFDDFYGFVNTGIDYYTHERYGVPSMYRNTAPTEADRGTYCTYLFEREALRFLDQQPADQPFFLYIPFNAPHNSSALDPKIRGTVQAPPDFEKLYPPVADEFRTGKRYGEETEVPTRQKRPARLPRRRDLHGRIDRQTARQTRREEHRRQHHRDFLQRQRRERRRGERPAARAQIATLGGRRARPVRGALGSRKSAGGRKQRRVSDIPRTVSQLGRSDRGASARESGARRLRLVDRRTR